MKRKVIFSFYLLSVLLAWEEAEGEEEQGEDGREEGEDNTRSE